MRNMENDRILERWVPLEADLRAFEEGYRSQRLRPQAKPYPEAAALTEMFAKLRSACELYLAASPEQRESMRSLFAWSYILPPYLLHLVTLRPRGAIEASEQSVRLALAAASLENNKTDYRDMLLALQAVYADAISGRIDPAPLFREAASWSSSRDDFGYGIPAMRDFILRFIRPADSAQS